MRKVFWVCFIALFVACNAPNKQINQELSDSIIHTVESVEEVVLPQYVDSADYFQRLHALANGDTLFWPVVNQPVPLAGAILPYKRIIAYYGNLYSKKMGALGEFPPEELWEKLLAEKTAWEEADPQTPVQTALHYIYTVADRLPKKDSVYMTRMPFTQVDSVLSIAAMHDAIVFLDIQVGKSSYQRELPLLEKYLKMPHVHLGIDPEFSMKSGGVPGKRIGNVDAKDVNFCANYLKNLVIEHQLPPKILVVHRFTKPMVTNYEKIQLHPEVQTVIHMDGWGGPELKKSTYRLIAYKEPVQFTGFKIFYKNDVKNPPHRLLTPTELMELKPQPIYIQYQ